MTDPVRDPDVVEAMAGKPRFSISSERSDLATDLWAYGEDALVDAALAASDEDLGAMKRIAAVYYDASYPLPLENQRITLGHVITFAGIAYLEGRLRPLARSRRRPMKDLPARLARPLPDEA